MSEILPAILDNLQTVGIGMLLFFLAYGSNMAFSIYYNIKVLGENFQITKIKNSILKLIAWVVGTVLLVVVVTTLPLFSAQAGLELPEDFVSTFSTLAILVLPVYASCKYAMMAYSKMKGVLESSTSDVETEGMNGDTEFIPVDSSSVISSSESPSSENTEDEAIPFEPSVNVPVVTQTINGIPVDKINTEVGTVGEDLHSESAVTAEPDAVDFTAMEAEQIITGEEVTENNTNVHN